MKRKIAVLALTAALALSSTSAFAAQTTDCTNYNLNDLSSLLKNYVSNYNCDDLVNNTSKVLNFNGKTIDLNSINWKSILDCDTNYNNKPDCNLETIIGCETEQNNNNDCNTNQEKPTTNKPSTEKPGSNNESENNNTSTPSSNLTYEQKVVELVNIERQKAGLAALTMDSQISNVARVKSKDMAQNKYFAHQSPTYGSAGNMLTQFGIKWSSWGENIAYGQRSPEQVVTAWMNSAGHRANILSSNFTKIGVGYVTNSNGVPYWTQIFAK